MTEEAELLFAREVVEVFPGSRVVVPEIEVDAYCKAFVALTYKWYGDVPDRHENGLRVMRDVVASYNGDPIRVARAQAVLERLEGEA